MQECQNPIFSSLSLMAKSNAEAHKPTKVQVSLQEDDALTDKRRDLR